MHADVVRASACEACPPNSNTPAGATHCACNPGWYGQLLGSDGPTSKSVSQNGSGCMPCAPGSYKDANGSHGCIACASGTYSSGGGASSCSACPAGVESISLAAEHDLGTLQQCRPEFKLACQEETEPHACFLVQVPRSVSAVSVMACRAVSVMAVRYSERVSSVWHGLSCGHGCVRASHALRVSAVSLMACQQCLSFSVSAVSLTAACGRPTRFAPLRSLPPTLLSPTRRTDGIHCTVPGTCCLPLSLSHTPH